MIPSIILSNTDKEKAISVFNHWLINEPVTLLVVIGEDAVAKMALDKANELINSSDPNYKSMRVIQPSNFSFISEIIKNLNVNPKLETIQWDHIEEYVILSISNKYNVIGATVLKSKFPNQPRGYINRALRKAQAYDKELL